MAILKVLQYPHPNLRNAAKPVEAIDDTIQQIVQDMIETMYADDGAGLAATQVDIPLRIVVMDLSDTHDAPQVFINPEIVEKEGEQASQEGCLSVPGLYETIKRAHRVKVRALNEKGETFEVASKGDLFSCCIQHETDHLNGVLFIDHLSPLKRERYLKKLKKWHRQKRL